jgi:hypothetical protein
MFAVACCAVCILSMFFGTVLNMAFGVTVRLSFILF